MIKRIQDLIQKRKQDKSRKDYETLIEQNPKDTRSRLKLGDLLAKDGKIADAVEQYSISAQIFAQAGFHLKSIALYKQILKIQPDSAPALRRAAQISYQYGLHADAYPYFEHLAEILRTKLREEKIAKVFQEVSHLPFRDTKQKIRVFEAIFPEPDAPMTDPFDRLCRTAREMAGEDRLMEDTLKLTRWMSGYFTHTTEALELHVDLLHQAGQGVELRKALEILEALYRSGDQLKEKHGFLEKYRAAVGYDASAGGLDATPDMAEDGSPDQVKIKMETNIYDLLKQKSMEDRPSSGDGGEDMPEGSQLDRLEFGDLFQTFKEGIQGQVARDDYETHYNLAIAYQEMGLFEDAIRELEIAAGDPTHRYDAYCLMGSCSREMEKLEEALDFYEKALSLEGLEAEQRLGVKYEQAITLRAAGQTQEALNLFQEIQGEEGDFRETEQQIQELLQASDT